MSMKSILMSGVAALAFAGAAWANPVNPGNTTLNPSAFETVSESEQVCPPPACANALINGPSSYTVTFTTPGLFGASITSSITGGGTFTTLYFNFFDAANNLLFSGTNLVDYVVSAALYTIEVQYTFQGGPGSASARWSMPLTTGPRLLPEPGTLALLGLGLGFLGFAQRRRR